MTMVIKPNSGGVAASRGSSGASVRLLGDKVIKMGDERVTWQGAWMEEHGTDVGIVPYPIDHGDNFYVLERFTELPLWIIDGVELVHRLHSGLEMFWRSEGSGLVQFNKYAHIVKLTQIVGNEEEELYRDITDLAEHHIPWDKLRVGRTHGDPTFDNTMLRTNGNLVLVDPLPASFAVPDLVSVDRGKMLTSILGFEELRYGRSVRIKVKDGLGMLDELSETDDERVAFRYWAAVHFLRAVPYMPDQEVKDALIRTARTALAWVRDCL